MDLETRGQLISCSARTMFPSLQVLQHSDQQSSAYVALVMFETTVRLLSTSVWRYVESPRGHGNHPPTLRRLSGGSKDGRTPQNRGVRAQAIALSEDS